MKKDSKRRLVIDFVSNLATQPLSVLAKAAPAEQEWTVRHRDFGTIDQSLLGEDACSLLLVHTDHRYFFASQVTAEAVRRSQSLVENAAGYAARTGAHVVLNTVSFEPLNFSLTAYAEETKRLGEINSGLLGAAEHHMGISAVDLAGLLNRMGTTSHLRERNRMLFQFPYSRDASAAIVAAYADHINLLLFPRKKVLLVDADNTLWKGVLGEVGAAEVGVDADYPNLVHFAFQQQLKALNESGIILCLVTKNNPQEIVEVFKRRAMPLCYDDFAIVKSNWQAKSINIQEIADELRLGLDSFVFIDDSEFELAEVSNQLPEVSVARFPHENPEAALGLLGALPGLRTLKVNAEDRHKTEQYRQEGHRQQQATKAGSIDEFIRSLNLRLFVSCNSAEHTTRIAQLTNKTNQFNLTTRRYNEQEIAGFMARGYVYDFRATDKFGDMGIIAVVIVVDGEIDTFLMSCRALGRRIESKILSFVCERCPQRPLRARYIKTPRNEQVADFLDRHGFERVHSTSSEVEYLLQNAPPSIDLVEVVGGGSS